MKIKHFVILGALYVCCSFPLMGQERDSMINTDSMYYEMYSDTSDYLDAIQSEDTSLSSPMASAYTRWRACVDHTKENFRNYHLCNGGPYVRIFSDEFNTLNSEMWFKKNGDFYDWNNWVSDAWPDAKPPCGKKNIITGKYDDVGLDGPDDADVGQQLYRKENVFVSNGILNIQTKKMPSTFTIPTCKSAFWPWTGPCQDGNGVITGPIVSKHFDFTSGRAQTTWAFSRLPNGIENFDGGGLIVEAMVKIPKEKGLWPAFWMVTNTDAGRYDEFDMFEILDNDFSKLKITIHAGDADVGNECKTHFKVGNSTSEINDWYNSFHTFTFYYTDYALTLFIDGHLVWQKHHLASKGGLGFSFPCDYSNSVKRRIRKRYNEAPMRIVFNTRVYCDCETSNGCKGPDKNNFNNAAIEVAFVNVYKKFPCSLSKTLHTRAELGIPDHEKEYNVIVSKKIVVDIVHSNPNDKDVKKNEFLKLIADEEVIISDITVEDVGYLEVELNKHRLCDDEYDLFGIVRPPQKHTSVKPADFVHNGDKKSEQLIEGEPNLISKFNVTCIDNVISVSLKDSLKINDYIINLYDFAGRLAKKNNCIEFTCAKGACFRNLSTGIYILEIQEIKTRTREIAKVVITK